MNPATSLSVGMCFFGAVLVGFSLFSLFRYRGIARRRYEIREERFRLHV